MVLGTARAPERATHSVRSPLVVPVASAIRKEAEVKVVEVVITEAEVVVRNGAMRSDR